MVTRKPVINWSEKGIYFENALWDNAEAVKNSLVEFLKTPGHLLTELEWFGDFISGVVLWASPRGRVPSSPGSWSTSEREVSETPERLLQFNLSSSVIQREVEHSNHNRMFDDKF